MPVGNPPLPTKEGFTEWKMGLLARLKAGPLRPLSDSPGLPSRLEPATVKKAEGSILFVRDEGDDSGAKVQLPGWLALPPTYTLVPRGSGPLAWSRKSPPNYVERAHALLGRTVDLGRVEDILAAVRKIRRESGGKVMVAGSGRAGILAAYAALLDPDIAGVAVINPPASHRDGPHFLGVQRILDVPDALSLLAPRPLWLIDAKDRAFERTTAIYAAAGAADKLNRK
ncbi:MAG: hypothetical protein U0736_13585 [Gemmataceae bacterium]